MGADVMMHGMKQPVNGGDGSGFSSREQIQFYQNMVSNITENVFYYRRELLDRLKDPRRDLYTDCGYTATSKLDPEKFLDIYQRFPIATRVVDLPVDESWRRQPDVKEVRDDGDPGDEETEFEIAWRELNNVLRGEMSWFHSEEGSPVWEYLKRGDKMSRIGQYGVIFLEFDDIGKPRPNGEKSIQQDEESSDTITWADPAPGFEEFDERGVFAFNKDEQEERQTKKGVTLIGLRTFDQVHAEVTHWNEDANSPMYGRPQTYRITIGDTETATKHVTQGLRERQIDVHWSRMIHLSEILTNSEYIGYESCRPVMNDLQDLQKIYGASGEGYWRAAFPGLAFESHPQMGGRVNINQDDVKTQLQAYQNTLQRHLAAAGGSWKTLSGEVVDPAPFIEARIEAICIYLGCPVRIFKGSERGELASTQDKDSWDERMVLRQVGYLTPRVIVPFIDRLIAVGVLPAPKNGYTVEWPDLTALSQTVKADLASKMTEAFAKYVKAGLDVFMPPRRYLIDVWEFEEEHVDEILEEVEDFQMEQLEAMEALGLEEGFQETDEEGNPIDEEGNPLETDEDGNPIEEEEGNPIDEFAEEDVEDEENEEDDEEFGKKKKKRTTNATQNECGAGSPGGKGFTKGNTCAKGGGKGKSKKPRFDTSIMQLPVPKKFVTKVREVRKMIKQKDKVRKPGGRWPHVTLLTGIKGEDLKTAREKMSDLKSPELEIEGANVFETPTHDVVILDIKKEGPLNALRSKMQSKVSAKPLFPNYRPHITIGFVKPGLGKSYAKQIGDKLKGLKFKPREIQFSNPEAMKTGVSLNEEQWVVIPFSDMVTNDCGAGSPGGKGFSKGNTCAKGGGASTSTKGRTAKRKFSKKLFLLGKAKNQTYLREVQDLVESSSRQDLEHLYQQKIESLPEDLQWEMSSSEDFPETTAEYREKLLDAMEKELDYEVSRETLEGVLEEWSSDSTDLEDIYSAIENEDFPIVDNVDEVRAELKALEALQKAKAPETVYIRNGKPIGFNAEPVSYTKEFIVADLKNGLEVKSVPLSQITSNEAMNLYLEEHGELPTERMQLNPYFRKIHKSIKDSVDNEEFLSKINETIAGDEYNESLVKVSNKLVNGDLTMYTKETIPFTQIKNDRSFKIQALKNELEWAEKVQVIKNLKPQGETYSVSQDFANLISEHPEDTPEGAAWIATQQSGIEAEMEYHQTESYVDVSTGKIEATDGVRGEFKQAIVDDVWNKMNKKGNHSAYSVASRKLFGGQDVVQSTLDTWADSSSDHNVTSLTLQAAVHRKFSKKFGTKPLDLGEFGISESLAQTIDGHLDDPDVSTTLDDLIDAVYENTQETLPDGDYTLFRGMRWRSGDIPSDVQEIMDQSPNWSARINSYSTRTVEGVSSNELIDSNPLSSFSFDFDTSRMFARGNNGMTPKAIVTAVVPKERIFSTFQTGPGCLTESEAVVIGSEDLLGNIVATEEVLPYDSNSYIQSLFEKD